MKAETLFQKAYEMGLVVLVKEGLDFPFYATVNVNHYFANRISICRTMNLDSDFWFGDELKLVDVSDDSIVLA